MDDRIKVVLGLDPVNSGGPPCAISPKMCRLYPVAPVPREKERGIIHRIKAASLIFRAASDVFNPDRHFNAIYFWKGIPSPGFYIDLGKVGHLSWLTNEQVIFLSRQTMVAWLHQQFFPNKRGLDDYFSERKLNQSLNVGHMIRVDRK